MTHLIWMLVLFVHLAKAQYYGGRCLCSSALQPPGQPFGAPPVQPFGAPPVQPFGALSGQPFGALPGQPFGAPPGQPFGAHPGQPFGAPPGQPFGAPPGQPFGPCAPPVPCPPIPLSCLQSPGAASIYPSYTSPLIRSPHLPMYPPGGLNYVSPHQYFNYFNENELANIQRSHLKNVEIPHHSPPFDTDKVTPIKSVEELRAQQIISPKILYPNSPLPTISPHPINDEAMRSLHLSNRIIPPSSYAINPSLILHPFSASQIPIAEPSIPMRQYPTHIYPSLNDCCIRCSSQCHYRNRRNLNDSNARADAAADADNENNHRDVFDVKCNNEELRNIMQKAIVSSDMASSKRQIQKLAEQEFGGDFHVICSSDDFSYIARTNTFCQTNIGDIFCYAFQTSTFLSE